MVLQRNKPIRIWGEGDGEVTVTFKEQNQTVCAKDGRWEITLNPENAGGPYLLKICSGDEEVVFCDVMIGDVWLAAGQSNMECVTFLAKDGISDASMLGDNNQIRYFTVPRRTREHEEVYRWHFESVLSSDKGWEVSTTQNSLHFSAIGFWFANLLQREENVPVGIISCNFGGTRIESWIDYDAIQKEPALAYAAEMYDGVIKNLDYDSYIIERKKHLEEVETFCKSYDALSMSKQMGLKQFAENPGLPWPDAAPMGPYSENFGGVLFLNMVKQIAPIGLSGILWYQGESNAGVAEHYCDAFSIMVKSWRDVFRECLPFLTVQVAPYSHYSSESARFVLNREQVRATCENEKVFLVTTGDVGEPHNIHPLDKKTVAKRLFAAAERSVYGKSNEYCGPVATVAEFTDEGNIIVSFDHAESGLASNDKVLNVYVENGEGNFVEAKAYTSQQQLIVECEAISNPKAIKMDFQNFSVANLYNAEGFPATPFYFELNEGLKC